MQGNQQQNLGQRWQEYRPSKAQAFWACAACVAATMIVGFSWGGWVTGGTARAMADDAAENARAQVVAAVCVDAFMAAADAPAQFAKLQEITSSYRRRAFVGEGTWAIVPGTDEVSNDAADLCARRLAEMEPPPPVAEAAAVPAAAAVAQ